MLSSGLLSSCRGGDGSPEGEPLEVTGRGDARRVPMTTTMAP